MSKGDGPSGPSPLLHLIFTLARPAPKPHLLSLPDQFVPEIRVRDTYEFFGPPPGRETLQVDRAVFGHDVMDRGSRGRNDLTFIEERTYIRNDRAVLERPGRVHTKKALAAF